MKSNNEKTVTNGNNEKLKQEAAPGGGSGAVFQ